MPALPGGRRTRGGRAPEMSLVRNQVGLCRLVQMPGGHEACCTNPARLAAKIVEAGRD